MKAVKETRKLSNKILIDKTVQFVKNTLEGAESGHDWWHIRRVWKNALLILENESADRFIVELSSLLHDIADSKFHDGNEEIGSQKKDIHLWKSIWNSFTRNGMLNCNHNFIEPIAI